MTDFTANPNNQIKPLVRRKSTDFLPGGVGFVKDSDSLRKFLDITLDQWLQVPQINDDSGYIGQKSGLYYNPALEFYLQEVSKDRTDYQLEATTVSVDANQNINFANFFQDLNNHLTFHGGVTNNENRLYSQEYYSWAPPINVDAFTNFSNYYWLVAGPTLVTITDTTNAVLNIIGKSSYTTTGAQAITLHSGMRIVFTNDANTEYNNISYIVEGVGTSIQLLNDTAFDGLGLFDGTPFDTDPFDGVDQSAPDYITIARGSLDQNPWSRTNRWFHKSLISNLNLQNFNAFQAKRPIIEFIQDIQLYNYGLYARTDVTLISTTAGTLDIAGKTSYEIDGTDLSDGNRILFTNDPDPAKNNRIYKVFGLNAYGVIGLSLETDGIDPTGAPVQLEKVYITDGNTTMGSEFYFNNGSWVASQSKDGSNQAPLFVLYDHDNVRLDDQGAYPQNNFTGSKIFEYVVDNSLTPDPYLGFGINFDTFGNIVFSNDINTQRFTYVLNFVTTEIIGYYFFKKFNLNSALDVFLNDWNKSSIESRQYVLDNFIITQNLEDTTAVDFSRLYPLSITPDANNSNELGNSYVYLQGIPLQENVDYQIIDGNVLELSLSLDLAQDDVLEVKSYAKVIDNVTGDGYFQIPKNLEANPNNDEITTISYSDMLLHFSSIINNQIGFIGVSTAVNNYYDTPRDLSRGSYILQHTAPLINLMLVSNNNDNLDFLTALRYSSREYTRFKRKFLNKISQLYMQGYNDTIPASIWVQDALNQINIGKTSSFPFYLSGMTGANNYIPSTAAALGVLPVYEPAMFLDTTRINQTNVIIGHDGSIINAYNNVLDSVVLELENQIYNHIVEQYRNKDVKREFDNLQVEPGYFRTTEYSRDEWLTLTIPAFERWASDNLVQYKTNTTYDSTNRFTWNYANSHAPNGTLLPGNWRGIYNYFYDTDRPHTNPWELLGFSQQPDWWVSQYGSAPYTGSNIIMWTDLQNGKVAQGDRAGTYANLARPGLLNIIPVDASGNLLDPITAGIVQDAPNEVFAQQDWVFGDNGPGEYTWRVSDNFSFALTEALYLANPAKFIGLAWEADDFTRINGQYVDNKTFMRRKTSDYTVHNEVLADGTTSFNYSISQWISAYLTSLGQDITTKFGNLLRQLTVQLGYRVGGFTKNDTLNLLSDSFGILPQEDITIQLYKSSSTSQPIYSGVLVEWTGSTYRVSGYDTVGQRFTTIPGIETGTKSVFSLGNIIITKYLTSSNTIQEVTYGTEFTSRQAVYNFLLSYQRWLISQGWVFDQIVPTTNVINDFDYAAQQFISWTTNTLNTNDVIVFSPLANEIKINIPQGQVDNIQTFVNGVYSIVDKDGLGILSSSFNINRENQQFSITMENTDNRGIFALRLSVVEYEHVVLINNITKFNDIIYEPLLGVRQPRLRAFIQRTAYWNGTPTALGFIINDNTLIDNFEKTTSDITEYFGFKDLEDSSITKKVAKHLIGYQDRDYLENLLLSKKSQFEFYRGFIREKGTKNSFNKILRNSFITETAGFNILEEWAFALGQYGNTTRKSSIQLQLIQDQFKTNPQQVQFITGSTDNPEDNIISITPNDSRWVLERQDNTTVNQFALRNFTNTTRADLPNSGYIRVDEPTFTIVQNSELADLYTNQKLNNVALQDGNLVWNIIDLDSSWNAFRLCSTAKIHSVIAGATVGDPAKIIFETNHNLQVADKIYVLGSTQSSPDYEGYQVVVGVIDSVTIQIEQPVSTPKTFGTGLGPDVLVIKSVRFDTITDRDNFTPPNGYVIGDLSFVDNAIGQLWAVYSWNGSGWVIVRQENDKVDTNQIYNTYIYNSNTNLTSLQLNLVDPYKGFILGNADRELYYKIAYDPAKYTNGDATVYQIDPDQAWSDNQVGRLWWDLSTVRFLDYEQDDHEYRFANWGKIAPGTSVDVYEWTRSTVPPSSWASFITSTPALTTYRPTGTLKYGSNQPYVVAQEYNEDNGRFENAYYFWVLNPSFSPPNVKFRNLSAQVVSELIQSPNNQNVAWFAPIATDAFLLCNINTVINDDSSVIEINFYIDSEESIIHKEWLLMSEEDSVNIPDPIFWNKMRDSLVGFDDMNLSVPDPTLKPIEKYGNQIRPRQSWFINRLQARKEFFLKANKIVNAKNVVDTISDWEDNLQGASPEPDSTQYDYKVFNRNDRDALIGTIEPGKKVLVEHDQTLRNKWTLWTYNGGSSFTLISQQLYNVEDYWSFMDWYATGYSSTTRINQTVANITAMNSGTYNVGDVIKVLDNGAGRFALYLYSKVNSSPVFTAIAEQNGTITFNVDTLSNYDTTDTLLDLEVSTVTKQIIFALMTNLLSIQEQNDIFYNMVHYVHVEQPIIDWAFKTSYIYGVGSVELLTQNYLLVEDQSENLLSYINEVKPYHVKVRGLIQQKEVPMELVDVQVQDTHQIGVGIKFDRVTSTSSIPDNANPADYDIDSLTAADRIQLLYQPTEGMPEKVLKQLISRAEFGGTILDGKGFYQFGSSLAAGYDSSEFDNTLGFDFDAADIESFYDVFINGTNGWSQTSGASDIIIEGNKFIQPNIAENHPEELVLARTGDAISIEVYTTSIGNINVGYDAEDFDIYAYDYDASDIVVPFGGSPKIRSKRFISTGSKGPFSIGQTPQSRQALFVYVAGDLLKETSDYTVNWSSADPLVTLVNNPTIGIEIKIVSFSIGGSTVLKRKTIRNTSIATFDLQTAFASPQQIFVTVDGNIATFTTSGTAITITSPTPSNSTVFIVIFKDNGFSEIETQEVIASGGVETFTIDRPAFSTTPVNYATTIVHKNGIRLAPPYIKVYDLTDPTQFYKIPETPVNANNVRVWIDVVELIQGTDFTVFMADNEVQLATTPLGSKITIMLTEGHQFEITGSDSDQLTILDGSIAAGTGANNPLALTAGDSIKITTFSEDVSLGIRTEVFNANALMFYPLGDKPFDTNSLWVTVNGLKQVYLADYVLADRDNGYDSEFTGYGMLFDSDMQFGVDFKNRAHDDSDRIIVTYFTAIPTADPIAFRLFKSVFGNWTSYRISDQDTTQLTRILNPQDQNIYVQDATILGQPDVAANIPGVVFIKGERIIFWEVIELTPGVEYQLTRVLRGTLGSGINVQQPIGTLVRDSSKNQEIPGGYEFSFTPNGLQQENTTLAQFLLAQPGTVDYTI